jgi:hypothetical protein
LQYNYGNFIKSKYFENNKQELVEKYNLVEFYDIIYEHQECTNDECQICVDDTFSKYVKCVNNHVICYDCYKCLMNKRICCVCNCEYRIMEMFYIR